MCIKRSLLGRVLGAIALLTMAGAANAVVIIEIDFDLSTVAPDRTFSGTKIAGGWHRDAASGSMVFVAATSGAPNKGFLADINLEANIADGVEATIRIFEDSFQLDSPTTQVTSIVSPSIVGPAETSLTTSIDGQVILSTGPLTVGTTSGTILATLTQPTTIEHLVSIKNNSGHKSTTTFDTTTRVPEPSAIALLGLGLLGFAVVRRRQLNG